MQPSTRKKWKIADPVPEDSSLGQYPAILQRLLQSRGIHDPEAAQVYLVRKGSLYDPFMMTDMEIVVDRIWCAIDQNETIAVYGDYDVDGVTATAVMVQVLKTLGAVVQGYIPNRFEEGYGLNMDALDHLKNEGVRLTITVDCGIRSPAETAHATEIGMDLIISDHHEPKGDVPDAFGVVCPKQAGDQYPEKNLAGVGLSYKICQAMLIKRPVEGVNVDQWLDLVAIGTIADIVPLVGENRTLVRAGLELLRKCRRQGLLSLSGAAGLDLQKATARDIGFSIGPRLNAAGRLESALASFDLLMATELSSAGMLAQKLDDQNRHRQDLTARMQEIAEGLSDDKGDGHILFAFHPDFNMGVVGLVASRLTEMYYRPSIVGYTGDVFTRASCRSIPEFHITRALDECADLMVRHGGHAMAAGFTVLNENLDEFTRRMAEIARRELADRDLCPTLTADMEIALGDLQKVVLGYIELLEPTGLSNPGAYFVTRGVKVARYQTVGKEKNHLRISVTDGRVFLDGIAFRQGHWAESMPDRIDILYGFEENVYQGRSSFQLNIRDLKQAGTPD
jgi:single-stranded-DNA-specific exonuclease